MAPTASSRDVTRLRLARHGLGPVSGTGRGTLTGPLEVVERLLAVQAQDFTAARWAVGVRAPGSSADDVRRAIDDASIVRSWPMRGTLHLVPAADLGWMLGLSAPRVLAGMRTRRGQLGLDDAIGAQATAVALSALTGGRQLSRAGFLAALEAAGISTAGQRGYHLIAHLALTGTVCWGRQVGSQQHLVLLDEWVRAPRRLEREEALGEFVLRYFSGHGPATLQDFAWWSQLTVADARVGLGVALGRLVELQVDGITHYWAAAADTGEAGGPPTQRTPVLPLPGFDEYLLGYRNRGFAVDDADFPRVVPGKNGIFLPLVLVNGRVAGTWRRAGRPGSPVYAVTAFHELTGRQRAGFDRAVQEYSRFFRPDGASAAEPAEPP
ncbi:winged helix DNA-binding domain-containing protein [Cryobacterium fucosi]|uniref:Winged helix DNA-binding domain-containing protein n=1 Tax=Cryobacterium fucosi TaxID=1259157 RepID=A0A4R9BB63_9MICO|nr:winged helix DNA-binding domain-containing protein [Cryobacterium fucosi]TFD79909.1 winged helix DNA-binding domain-containing protein [Cryobacterium fucosi]